MVNITHSLHRPMQHNTMKRDVIEVTPYVIHLFHRVQCIWLKGHIQAMAFITVFALYPEAII